MPKRANDPFRPRRGAFTARGIATRPQRKRFLILCEGAKTEPNYFYGFRLRREIAEIEGVGRNTLSLVEEAIRKRDEFLAQGIEFDQTWCVFDRDSFGAQLFNEAIRRARAAGMHVAYSNEAFELWYLLHFDFHTSALSRAQYGGMLTQRLGSDYRKNREDIYQVLLPRQGDAIRNARRLLQEYHDPNGAEIESETGCLKEFRGLNPEADNPSTTVHCLVEELNRELER